MSIHNGRIKDVYPLKAQFLEGEPPVVAMDLANPGMTNESFLLKVQISNLLNPEEELTFRVALEPGEIRTIEARFQPQEVDCRGYGVDVFLYRDDRLEEVFSSAFDVVSDYHRAIRYGFLCDFAPGEENDGTDILSMCKLHLNLVQFYDWMYRHDDYLPPEAEFDDVMGRHLSMETVKRKIDLCHQFGMRAIAYGAVYAASAGFYGNHPDWGLYDSAGQPFHLAQLFYIMNIAPDSPWRRHLIGEYEKALAVLGFDGIHMDAYGFPKAAFSHLQPEPRLEKLAEQFPTLIDQTRRELQKLKPDPTLLFNAVGNWPVAAVARAAQDAVYIEVWKPYERYHHLQQLIRDALRLGGGKPVILAAYLQPFSNPGETLRREAETAALFLTAAIAANGGYHLVLGETMGILTEGYYVRYAALGENFYRIIRNYYDFIVRYTNLLFDAELTDVSMTHLDGDNKEYEPVDFSYSTYGEAGRVWLIIREKPGRKTISAINLTGNSDDLWNNGKKDPAPIEGLTIRVQLLEPVRRVYVASPDLEMGRPLLLDYRIETGERGKILVAEIPRLSIWSMLVIESA